MKRTRGQSKGRVMLRGTERCQCSKTCYPRGLAWQMASLKSRETDTRILPYKCPTVGGVWHIGHPNPKAVAIGSREEKRAVLAQKLQRQREAS